MRSLSYGSIVHLARSFLQSAVAWKLASSGLRFGGFIFILPITLRKLSTDDLGMWYTMLAAVGLTGLLDMGFSPTASRMASYFWGGAKELEAYSLNKSNDGNLGRPNLEGLERLTGTMRWFYLGLGITGVALLSIFGTPWVISHAKTINPQYLYIWGFLLFSLMLNSVGSVWPNLLSGIGGVRDAEITFVVATAGNYLISAILLLLGFNLWAVAIGSFFSAISTRFLGRLFFFRRVGKNFKMPIQPDVTMLKVLWPTAWRTGLVGLGGFAILYGSRLICAAKLDLATAASFALTQQLFMAISQISSAWLQVKIPLIASFRIQGQINEIRQIVFSRLLLSSFSFLFITAVFIVTAPTLFVLIKSKTDLLAAPLLGFFALIYLAETLAGLSYSIVLTENRNPFILPTVVFGTLAVGAYWVLAPKYGVAGLLFAQAAIGCCFSYWGPFRIAMKGIRRNR